LASNNVTVGETRCRRSNVVRRVTASGSRSSRYRRGNKGNEGRDGNRGTHYCKKMINLLREDDVLFEKVG
jgi:hypothetical protein